MAQPNTKNHQVLAAYRDGYRTGESGETKTNPFARDQAYIGKVSRKAWEDGKRDGAAETARKIEMINQHNQGKKRMTFRIHFTHSDGTEDSLKISGDTLEQIRDAAAAELKSRGVDPATAWSEEVKS